MQHRGEKATLKRHCVGVARPQRTLQRDSKTLHLLQISSLPVTFTSTLQNNAPHVVL